MPIEVSAQVELITDDEFEKTEYALMGIAFDIHNEYGRLCDEKIYQALMAMRCSKANFRTVEREVLIRVTHGTFRKPYYIDVLVNGAVIVELKTVKELTGDHVDQVINYLLLCNLSHGKLINMRPESVEGRRVQTRLTQERRRELSIVDDQWCPCSDRGDWFRKTLLDLLDDWGGFLSTSLYTEAIEHFLGGREAASGLVDFEEAGQVIGRQRLKLLDPSTAFEITAIRNKPHHYEEHLRRLLHHTDLNAVSWVNMNNHEITFKTLR